jgi:hypothetical protein
MIADHQSGEISGSLLCQLARFVGPFLHLSAKPSSVPSDTTAVMQLGRESDTQIFCDDQQVLVVVQKFVRFRFETEIKLNRLKSWLSKQWPRFERNHKIPSNDVLNPYSLRAEFRLPIARDICEGSQKRRILYLQSPLLNVMTFTCRKWILIGETILGI